MNYLPTVKSDDSLMEQKDRLVLEKPFRKKQKMVQTKLNSKYFLEDKNDSS